MIAKMLAFWKHPPEQLIGEKALFPQSGYICVITHVLEFLCNAGKSHHLIARACQVAVHVGSADFLPIPEKRPSPSGGILNCIHVNHFKAIYQGIFEESRESLGEGFACFQFMAFEENASRPKVKTGDYVGIKTVPGLPTPVYSKGFEQLRHPKSLAKRSRSSPWADYLPRKSTLCQLRRDRAYDRRTNPKKSQRHRSLRY